MGVSGLLFDPELHKCGAKASYAVTGSHVSFLNKKLKLDYWQTTLKMFCPISHCCTHHTLSETQQLCCWAVGRKRRPVRGYRVTPRVTVVAQEHSVCVLTVNAGGHKWPSVALRSRCLRWMQTNLHCQYFTLLNHRYVSRFLLWRMSKPGGCMRPSVMSLRVSVLVSTVFASSSMLLLLSLFSTRCLNCELPIGSVLPPTIERNLEETLTKRVMQNDIK